MNEKKYDYVIVGAGLSGASAVEGIRERDTKGSILLIGEERHMPYHRPPLTKALWSGKKQLEGIFIQKEEFYTKQNIAVKCDTKVVAVHPDSKTVTDTTTTYRFEKLLLATGGIPKRLQIPGGELPGIVYYRYLDDYLNIHPKAQEGKSVIVIGGGFIGTEIAAAFTLRKLRVTQVFPQPRPCYRIFPYSMGNHILKKYRDQGITVLADDLPVAIEKNDDTFLVHTKKGHDLSSDLVIAGIGIAPSIGLAKEAGLAVAEGILVNSFLQTSHPDIYAAGDNANYPDPRSGSARRAEHWDNALNQGKLAGKNMTGAQEPYTYMPYFFSDLFDFGYEAVGEIDSRLETRAEWQEQNEKGIVYYVKENTISGVLLCNVWGKVDTARASIRNNEPIL